MSSLSTLILVYFYVIVLCGVLFITHANVDSEMTPLSSKLIQTHQVDKKFYIYPLDQKFWWRWPDPDANCSHQGYLSHSHALNSGMGNVLDLDSGMMNTWHDSMFNSIFNRLKRSKRRTYDPEEASLFVIPYDLGLDGYIAPNCRLRKRCSTNYVEELKSYLLGQKYFPRTNGTDHVVLWSLGMYHPWPRNGGNDILAKFCKHCATTCYWMDPVTPMNFMSVPFPSSYHWWDGIKTIPWDDSTASERTIPALYIGATQTLNPDHTKIRRAMAAQCQAHANCTWLQISHSSMDNSLKDFISSYRRSVFCLCPPGDDPARKALFDILLSGCIPVIFHVSSLFNQYLWHIGEKLAREISVNIPGRQVSARKLQFMDFLLNISPETIRRKQRAIAELAPRLQYSMPPLHMLSNISDETPWDPPFRDAVDVMLDGMVDRAEKLARNESTGYPEIQLGHREW
eukprot:CAMPEP_0185021362 /NCGR_PEP_ID=MMETSP1103-20130426/4054_1 /TAXON_ID=36769 /ORGANISM="Paraphysomonas bandaiensis, Strain Caron Lab Isolate" /LENGTH=455 /DNA_ID=CAMNT_0027552847 /DNA_START=102 /DNA_END=1466 /DNA_ORIENTATION=+